MKTEGLIGNKERTLKKGMLGGEGMKEIGGMSEGLTEEIEGQIGMTEGRIEERTEERTEGMTGTTIEGGSMTEGVDHLQSTREGKDCSHPAAHPQAKTGNDQIIPRRSQSLWKSYRPLTKNRG